MVNSLSHSLTLKLKKGVVSVCMCVSKRECVYVCFKESVCEREERGVREGIVMSMSN
jgi:hypothetical protein